MRALPEEAGAVRVRGRDLHEDGRHQGVSDAARGRQALGGRLYIRREAQGVPQRRLCALCAVPGGERPV